MTCHRSVKIPGVLFQAKNILIFHYLTVKYAVRWTFLSCLFASSRKLWPPYILCPANPQPTHRIFMFLATPADLETAR